MAVRYYGVGKGGQGPVDVTVDSSTTSSAIELAVNDAALSAGAIDKKKFIVEALEAILQKVQEDAV